MTRQKKKKGQKNIWLTAIQTAGETHAHTQRDKTCPDPDPDPDGDLESLQQLFYKFHNFGLVGRCTHAKSKFGPQFPQIPVFLRQVCVRQSTLTLEGEGGEREGGGGREREREQGTNRASSIK
jgi:hypothetical protein